MSSPGSLSVVSVIISQFALPSLRTRVLISASSITIDFISYPFFLKRLERLKTRFKELHDSKSVVFEFLNTCN